MSLNPTSNPPTINPQAFYDERSAVLATRVPVATLARARREGTIRYSRRGASVYFLGAWLIDWLIAGEVAPETRELAKAQ